MSPCSLATAIVSVVAVIHFILTVILTVATILVRRQSKKIKSQSSAKKDVNVPESSVRENAAYSQGSDVEATPEERKQRRSGQTSPPELTVDLVQEDIEKEDLSLEKLYQEPPASQKVVGPPSERISSAGPFKRASSSGIPFRRASSGSQLRRKSGRFSLVSITSKLSRRSVDVEGEELHLIETSMTTPEEEKQYDLSTSPAESEGSALRSEETLDIGGRNILALSDDPKSELEC